MPQPLVDKIGISATFIRKIAIFWGDFRNFQIHPTVQIMFDTYDIHNISQSIINLSVQFVKISFYALI